MAKIKFGKDISVEIGVASELKPRGSHNTKPLSGGLNMVEYTDSKASDIVQEVLKSLPSPEAPSVDLHPLESRLDALDGRLSRYIEKSMKPIEKIETPEIKQITHHKNHDKELGHINSVLSRLIRDTQKTIKRQNTINLALSVGIILTILSHLL